MAYFILGMAAGIVLHRIIMRFVLLGNPDTRCAYCKWIKKETVTRHDGFVRKEEGKSEIKEVTW